MEKKFLLTRRIGSATRNLFINFCLKLILPIFILTLALTFTACGERINIDPDIPAYNIGDIGPGGGIIFYRSETGFNLYTGSTAWDNTYITAHYLEVAPAASTEFTSIEWGASGMDVIGTGVGIGYGRRNTKIIAAFLESNSESDKAAQLCNSLTVEGQTDWFLPSLAELNELYKSKDVVGGFSTGHYWSSSESDSDFAYMLDFSDGGLGYDSKDSMDSVCAVRAF